MPLTALAALTACLAQAPPGLTLYLSPAGNDAWSGHLAAPNAANDDGPFATLDRARDEIRKLKAGGGLPAGGVVVELAGGVYELQQPFALAAEDSGSAEAPIEYRARRGEEVRLVGGKVLSGWSTVTDQAVLDRLEPEARGKVLQTDLRAQGVADLGEMTPGPTWAQSEPGLELFFEDQPMALARWPNEGFVKIVAVHGPTPQDIRGTKGCMEGIIEYEGDRPKRWAGEPDIMLEGYWFWDWADQRLKVQSIDTDRRIITLEPKPQHSYGFRKGQWFYAYNLLSEIDQPGEWYVDRDKGILYFWPPSDVTQGKPMISVTPSLVTMQDVTDLTVRGLILEATRRTAVTASNVDRVRIAGCTIRNTGSWAVSMSGKESGVVGCDIYNTADGGVSLSGGDRKTLTPANLYVDNCHIYRFERWNPVYKPAVMLSGVGQRVSHNLIHDAPHMAIGFGGNDHLIELNEIHSVVYESNDAGVMYAGRNATMRGNVIRHNYLHHIYGYESRGCVGIYLDDMFCSAEMSGNLFYQVPRATFIGGGRDNTIANNIYVDCNPAVHIDARALGWAAPAMPGLENDLKGVPYQEEPWRTRFPQLLTYLADEPAVPKGNVVARNVCWGGRWDEVEGKARPHVQFEDNLVGEDPRFVDPEHLNFQLRDDSPAWKLGFQRIPIEQIGLYQSEDRASWPVTSEVRPKPEGPPPVAARPARTAPVVFRVARTEVQVTVDGRLDPAEWGGLKPEAAMPIEQGIQSEQVAPRSLAWLAQDGTALYVAVDNQVEGKQAIRMTGVWGQDDAVELALSNPAVGKPAPILVLRGYPSGKSESSDEAGAPAALVANSAQGVQFAARVVAPDRWTAEWRIPFAALGLDPAKWPRYQFNLSVRKPAEDKWLMWQGTAACTWQVDQAGLLELTP